MKTQVTVLGRRITTFFVLLFALLSSSKGFAHPMLEYWQNRTGSHSGLILEPRVGFFSTSRNFDPNSNLVAIQNSATNSRSLLDLNGSYGISDNFFILGRLSGTSTSVQVPNQIERTGLGFSDLMGGLSYRFYNTEEGASFSLQGEVKLPSYSNSTAKTNGKAYLGDGSTDLTGGLFVELPVRWVTAITDLYSEFGVGYTYRSNGFSSAIPWSILLKRDPAFKGFVFESGLMGQLSLKTDIASTDAGILANTNSDRLTGSGGSYLINGVNSSWMNAFGKLGFKNKSGHTYYAGLSTPLLGTAAPSGVYIFGGASFDFGATHAPHEDVTPSAIEKARRQTSTRSKEFSSYDLEARITSVNDQLYLVKIDKGATNSVEKGQLFDIFLGNKPLARAKVTQVNDEAAALTVLEYYLDHWIETGSTARRLLR